MNDRVKSVVGPVGSTLKGKEWVFDYQFLICHLEASGRSQWREVCAATLVFSLKDKFCIVQL